MCAEAGLVRAGLVALDGAKLRANASRERNRTLAQLEAEVERMLAKAERAETAEQRAGRRDDSLPTALRGRAQRLARLSAAKQRLEARDQERQDAYEARRRERAQKDPRGRPLNRPKPDPEARVST